MMHPALQGKMLCQTCPSRNRVRIAVDDANRIVKELESLIRGHEVSERSLDTHVPLLHQVMRCNFTANNCNHFRQHQYQLEQTERVLNMRFRQISALVQRLNKESRNNEAALLAEQSRRLLAGHYPTGARYLSRFTN